MYFARLRTRIRPIVSALCVTVVWGAACSGPQIRDLDVSLEDPAGVNMWQIEPGEAGLDLEDSAARTIAQFELLGGVIVFRHADQRCEVAMPAATRDELRVTCEDAEAPAYVLHREPDGDYRLMGGETIIAKFKKRDYGYKVEAADGSERKLRVKPDKIQLRDANDQELFSTKGELSPLGAACFAVDGIPIEVRAALCVAVEHWQFEV